MHSINMPKAGQTMEEGLVLRWLKQEGQAVEAGEVILEVETDKAVIEVPSEAAGVLRKILVTEGQRAPVMALLAYVGEEGELPLEKRVTDIEAPADDASRVSPAGEVRVQPTTSTRPISPRARKLAVGHQIDLALLSGSGPGGRITESDVAEFLTRSKPLSKRPRVLSKRQQATGKLLQRSVQTVPHFFLVTDIGVDRALELRDGLKTVLHVTINDLIVKAVGFALVECPEVNSRWDAESLVYNDFINVGIAVNVDGELLTAIVEEGDKKSLREIAVESRAEIERAKGGVESGMSCSLTISNLGMYGVRQFTAIIPLPAVAILAVGEITAVPGAAHSGLNSNTTRKMTFTLSCDHRALNGAHGARFLQVLKGNLEHPESWLRLS